MKVDVVVFISKNACFFFSFVRDQSLFSVCEIYFLSVLSKRCIQRE